MIYEECNSWEYFMKEENDTVNIVLSFSHIQLNHHAGLTKITKELSSNRSF